MKKFIIYSLTGESIAQVSATDYLCAFGQVYTKDVSDVRFHPMHPWLWRASDAVQDYIIIEVQDKQWRYKKPILDHLENCTRCGQDFRVRKPFKDRDKAELAKLHVPILCTECAEEYEYETR